MKKVWIVLYVIASLMWFVMFIGFVTGNYYPKNSQIGLSLLFSSIYFLMHIYFLISNEKKIN